MGATVLPRLKRPGHLTSLLDDRPWIDGLAIASYGVRIGVRATDCTLLEQIQAHLPFRSRRSSVPAVDRLYSLERIPQAEGQEAVLYADDIELVRAPVDEALSAFASHAQLTVAELAPARTFVHAGVVTWGGKAILLPGRSFAGKTTLVRELIGLGSTYYSDEYAVLDAGGQVYPFPRPLGIRPGERGRAHPVSARVLGARSGRGPASVGLVALLRFKPEAPWEPEPLPPARVALELLANTVSARTRPVQAVETVGNAARRATGVAGLRGEAREVAPLLLAYLDSPVRP